uniref:Uncharacterized protein n=1 Tax=Biomphalaria glabrata TaxID=6526 RepID=A0A2C9LUY3_BIOGL
MIKLKHTTFMSLNAGEFWLVITTFIWNQNILCFANATRHPGVSDSTCSISTIQTTSTSKNQCCVQSKECIKNCTNVTLSTCNATLNDSLVCCCNSSVSPLSANNSAKTALILSSVFILLAICIAFVVVVLRRRKRALINSRKYTLMARFSSTKQAKDEARNTKKPVRIKSFRLVEDHCYEVVEDKPQLLCLSLTVVTDAKNCDSVALAKKPLSQVIRMFGQGHGEQADDNTIRSHPPFVPAPFVTK